MAWFYLLLTGYALGAIGPRSAPFSSRAVARLIAEVVKGAALYILCSLLFGLYDWHLAFSFAAYAAGRRFPVYPRLRGVPAVEAGAAFMLSILIGSAVSGDFPLEILGLAAAVAAALSITRRWQIPMLAVSFLIGIIYPLAEGDRVITLPVVLLSVYLFGEALFSMVREKIFSFRANGEMKIWRMVARPFALLFVLIDIFGNRRVLLFVIGVVALIFIIMDFVRLSTKKSVRAMFKKKEANRFSSMTLFLVSAFLTFLLFPSTIPYVSLICITFGDFFSKIIGISFGTIKLYKSRTLQGTLGFLAGSLIFNTIASAIFAIPVIFIVIGSTIAAITELFSETIDDNFSVSIVTGGVLSALRYFLAI